MSGASRVHVFIRSQQISSQERPKVGKQDASAFTICSRFCDTLYLIPPKHCIQPRADCFQLKRLSWLTGLYDLSIGWLVGAAQQDKGGDVILAFVDPCPLAAHPGWPLRNLLLMAAATWRVSAVKVACVRHRGGHMDPSARCRTDLPAGSNSHPGQDSSHFRIC